MIYTSAIYANPDLTMVTGTDANGNTETVPAAHTLFRQPDDGPVGFVNNGGVIADYVDPEPASPYLPLKPYQFWGAVRATGHQQALNDWVASIPDPVEKAVASSMLEFSLEFRRDHPLMEAARVTLGMSETELDDLWLWGLTL